MQGESGGCNLYQYVFCPKDDKVSRALGTGITMPMMPTTQHNPTKAGDAISVNTKIYATTILSKVKNTPTP